jgi:hypothetical protein
MNVRFSPGMIMVIVVVLTIFVIMRIVAMVIAMRMVVMVFVGMIVVTMLFIMIVRRIVSLGNGHVYRLGIGHGVFHDDFNHIFNFNRGCFRDHSIRRCFRRRLTSGKDQNTCCGEQGRT